MSSIVEKKTAVIALAGQPNTGKSTVFNRLTGAKQHVGNWPGKTVEQKEGLYDFNGCKYSIVDLPGTYSLTSNSVEEKISGDFLINNKPDAVIVMADASQLERTLYLLTEVKLLSVPAVVALNMMDVAEKQGREINAAEIERRTGTKVIPMTASRGRGIEQLKGAVENICRKDPEVEEDLSIYPEVCSRLLEKLKTEDPYPYNRMWLSVKLAEGDSEALDFIARNLDRNKTESIINILGDMSEGPEIIAAARYKWITKIISAAVKLNAEGGVKKRGKKFDKAATHPVFGGLIAVIIMILSFAAAMAIAMPLMFLIKPLTAVLTDAVRSLFPGSFFWFGSMLADGLIPGLSVAFMMLAYIFGVYLVFGFLEDIGYLPRMAYVFDRLMNRVGLHGKSFMPLLMSFGCNIAGVTGTRVIDSWQQRMVTLVMASIVPCMALWAVVSFIGTLFFASFMPLVVLSLFVVMFIHLALTSYVMRRYIVRGETTGLIMELPPYHRPDWKTIFSHVFVLARAFIKRAVTLIALLSVIVWALSYQKDGNMENSALAVAGRFFDPFTSLLGLDWKLFIALMAAMIAKEASLSVIAVLYNVGGGALSITSLFFAHGNYEQAALAGSIINSVHPASALAFIFAFFFSIPCLGTVATIYSETKSLKWTIGSSLYYIVFSFIAAAAAYRIGLLIF